MKRGFQEKGQALVLIALAVVILLGFTAIAIDGSRTFSDRRHAQNAADTSALAAALSRQRAVVNKDATAQTAALQRAASNSYDNNGTSNTVTVSFVDTPSGGCPATGKDITVTIISHISTTFGRILGRSEMVNNVNATARSCDISGGKPLYSGSAVWSTKTTGTCNGTSAKSLYVGGSGSLNVYGGGLGASMSVGSCIDFSGGVTTLYNNGTDCGSITTAASSIPPTNLQNYTNTCSSDPVVEGVQPASPPADLHITCSGNATVSGSFMNPGNYTGTFPPSGVTALKPGTYCVTGDFRLNANDQLGGTGVTIVMKTGTVFWNGGSDPELTAPTSGDYKGLLIYVPPSNTNDVTIDGNSNATITGTVLAQNSNCYYAGTGDVQKQTLQFICSTWQTNGNGTVELVYDSSLLYSPIIYPTISMLK
jgi:putative Flp pilus-assembly TadE/G-like protein